MNKQYSYPLDFTWSTGEISSVLSFLNQVEKAYEGGVDAEILLDRYQKFKAVVKSKAQEKQIDRDFEAASGYSTYRAVKAAQEKQKGGHQSWTVITLLLRKLLRKLENSFANISMTVWRLKLNLIYRLSDTTRPTGRRRFGGK